MRKRTDLSIGVKLPSPLHKPFLRIVIKWIDSKGDCIVLEAYLTIESPKDQITRKAIKRPCTQTAALLGPDIDKLKRCHDKSLIHEQWKFRFSGPTHWQKERLWGFPSFHGPMDKRKKQQSEIFLLCETQQDT